MAEEKKGMIDKIKEKFEDKEEQFEYEMESLKYQIKYTIESYRRLKKGEWKKSKEVRRLENTQQTERKINLKMFSIGLNHHLVKITGVRRIHWH